MIADLELDVRQSMVEAFRPVIMLLPTQPTNQNYDEFIEKTIEYSIAAPFNAPKPPFPGFKLPVRPSSHSPTTVPFGDHLPSLCASLRHNFPILSVFSHVNCRFIFFHICMGVVDPSPFRPQPFCCFSIQLCPSFFLRGCLILVSWCVHTKLICSVSGIMAFGFVFFCILLYDLVSDMVLPS